MKKPNKAQRHAIYKKALVWLDEHVDECLCRCICRAWSCESVPAMMPRFFPELESQRPKRRKLYWWSFTKKGNAARRHALLRCIEMSAPKPRKKP